MKSEQQGAPRPGHYKRVVVKAGTTLLTGGTDNLDNQIMSSLVSQIAHLIKQGTEIIFVSSGAVAAGRYALENYTPEIYAKTHGSKNKEIHFKQVLAAIGQSRLMHSYEELFSSHGIPVAQALLTHRDVGDRQGYLNIRNTLLSLLALRIVPILNENDVASIEELEADVIGDNDNLSALVANMVDADLLIMLGDVPGLYTSDPHANPDAELIPRIAQSEIIQAEIGESTSGLGRGGMVTKLDAARLVTSCGTTAVIADGRSPNILIRIVDGQPEGTWFAPTFDRLESRQRWMLSIISHHGAVMIDAGAVEAVCRQNSSLLPAGIFQISGNFERGEVVPIKGPNGMRIAAGIINYSSRDLNKIKGLHSEGISMVLGYQYGSEVIHRNNMVLV